MSLTWQWLMMLWYRLIAGEGRRRLPWALHWRTSENRGLIDVFILEVLSVLSLSSPSANLDLIWHFTAGTWRRFLSVIALLHQVAAALPTWPGDAAALFVSPPGWVTVWLMPLVNFYFLETRQSPCCVNSHLCCLSPCWIKVGNKRRAVLPRVSAA